MREVTLRRTCYLFKTKDTHVSYWVLGLWVAMMVSNYTPFMVGLHKGPRAKKLTTSIILLGEERNLFGFKVVYILVSVQCMKK
jgi:hypothetical protein